MSSILRLRMGITIVVLGAALTPALAQWSSNPASALRLADLTNEQVQPKIVATDDGGAYVSWYDNFAGGYDTYLQRLDSRGYEQWAHNGILLLNTSFSSTQDYGMTVDALGNAALALRDDAGGATQIRAMLVNPSGVVLWSVSLVSTSEFLGNPKIAALSDGGYGVGWSVNSDYVVQKLDAQGQPAWPQAVRVTPSIGTYTFSYLVPSTNGDMIAVFVHRNGSQSFSPRHLAAQKHASANGASLWTAPYVAVFNGTSLQNGYFPIAYPDGAGGAVFCWYETGGTRKAYAQRVDVDGVEVFPHNGVALSTSANIHLQPGFSYDPVAGEIFAAWPQTNTNQSQYGVYAQKITAIGGRAWGDTGIELVPFGTPQPGNCRTVPYAGGAMVFYTDNNSGAQLRAVRLDAAGQSVWPGSPLIVNSPVGTKSRLDVARTPSGMAMLAWQDGPFGSADILAQNVNPDATLGLPAWIVGDMNCDGAVNFSDIDAFVDALGGEAAYEAAHPECKWLHADGNVDGTVDFSDIDAFIDVLSN